MKVKSSAFGSDAGRSNKLNSVGRRERNHLSRSKIVAEALKMLSQGSLDALTLRGLATQLGVGVMSLYTHFPSRDALVNGVADHVFTLFEHPEKRDPWQDYIRAWLWATYRLFERFPVAPKIILWNKHVHSPWLKTWLPVARLLKDLGLAGSDLAFALEWFATSGMSFVVSHMDAPARRQPSVLAFVADLHPSEQQLALELWTTFPSNNSNDILAFGFEQIIQGLEVLVQNAQEPAANR